MWDKAVRTSQGVVTRPPHPHCTATKKSATCSCELWPDLGPNRLPPCVFVSTSDLAGLGVRDLPGWVTLPSNDFESAKTLYSLKRAHEPRHPCDRKVPDKINTSPSTNLLVRSLLVESPSRVR